MPTTARTTSDDQPCNLCPRPATLSCAECKDSHYCSAACADRDSSLHRKLCWQVSASAAPPANLLFLPGELRRGIFFPAGGAPVRFVWIAFDWVSVRAEKGRHNQHASPALRVKAFLGPGCGVEYAPVPPAPGRRNTLELVYRDSKGGCWEATGGEAERNAAVHDFIAENAQTTWRGPVLALKRRGIVEDGQSHFELPYCDVGINDLRDVVEFLQDYNPEGNTTQKRSSCTVA